MQTINKTPIKVDINVESIKTTTSAFYTIGFICETIAIDTPLVVETLDDLLLAGFYRYDLAYNFCLGVFSQNKMTRVIIIPKQPAESYFAAFTKHDSSNYYYVCLDTKEISKIVDFQNSLKSSGYNKLLFFSHINNYENEVEGLDLVYYYEEPFDIEGYLSGDLSFDERLRRKKVLYAYEKSYSLPLSYSLTSDGSWSFDDNKRLGWDELGSVLLDYKGFDQDFTQEEAQSQILAYPEAAWVAYCGWYFPSHIQWAYKTLNRVREVLVRQIPSNSTCSTRLMFNQRATTEYASTASGVKIEHYVSLDWLKAAIEWNIWQTLLKSETLITFSKNGNDLLESKLREVLEFAVEENIFTDYRITERSFDYKNYKASYKFSATLTHSILGVDKVEGTIYH